MKTYMGKTKGGSIYKGIYSTSQVPNHKPKRVRKSKQEEIESIWNGSTVKFNVNMMGIFGAIVTIMSAPLNTGWKIGLAAMFIISSLHVEVKDDNK